MKKLLLSLLLAPLALVAAVNPPPNPYEQRFAWQPSPETNVHAYTFYLGTNSLVNAPQNIRRSITITNVSWIGATNELFAGLAKTNFIAGVTNFVFATARTTDGAESLPSNEVQFVPPRAGQFLRLTTQESASVDGPWEDLPAVPPVELPLTEPQRFYRLAYTVVR